VLLHALKESGQTSLVSLLAKPMAPLLSELCNQIERPILMPVPSSKQNYLARGFTPAKVLASHVNRQAHHPCRLIEGLRFVRRVQDQSGLDAIMRRMNLDGSMVASRRLSGAKVILLDDIVTTGSTMAEAARAIEEGGGQVVGFLAFAETILKTQTKI
jgi:predicted amidophosphoribosyltransferase